MGTMIRRALGALALATAVLAGAAPAAAEQAFWVARDADSTVWLYGTIHVLDAREEWLPEAVSDAFYAADELWLEVDLLGEGAGLVLMLRYGTSPDRPLSGRLTEAENTRLAEVAASVGLKPSALEGLRPWFAATTIGLKMARKAGLSETGVDLRLARIAAMREKPTHGFETADEQMRILSGLPEDVEMEMFRAMLAQADKGQRMLSDLIDAWYAGDIDHIAALTEEGFADGDRAAADLVEARLITDRNRRFAERIAAVMSGSGTHFVAVGAAHLAGKDSVQDVLAEMGIAVERVNGGE